METVIFIKAIGKMIKLMEKVYTFIKMDQVILDNGIKIYNMVLVFKNGLMAHLIKGNIYFYLEIMSMELNMVTESLHGQMDLHIKVLNLLKYYLGNFNQGIV